MGVLLRERYHLQQLHLKKGGGLIFEDGPVNIYAKAAPICVQLYLLGKQDVLSCTLSCHYAYSGILVQLLIIKH